MSQPQSEGMLPSRNDHEREVPRTKAHPQLTILYFNDLHGHLLPFRALGDTTSVGGAARLATLIQRVRAENAELGRPTLLLEAGDILQGTPMSSVFKGEPDFEFLNRIGLDAMVLGNHEFDFGLDVLRQRVQQAAFPVLGANVRQREGGARLAKPYVLRTLSNGVRLAIFGLVTDETPQTTDPMNVTSLVFEAPLTAASRFVPALDDRVQILIGLTHIGSETDQRLADAFDDIDVIVGGHDQILINHPLVEDDVIIMQAEDYGLYLGRVDLRIDDNEVELLSDTLYPITSQIPEDKEISELVGSYARRLDRELSGSIGRLATALNGERQVIRREPTNLGTLLATLMMSYTGADLGVINSGGIRSSIAAGIVTRGDILQALPFRNRVLSIQLSGADLERLLAQSVEKRRQRDSGGFLQVAGVTYEEAPWGPTDMRVDKEALDPAKLYTVAITDFLYNGGDGYSLFNQAGKNLRDSGALLADILCDHIHNNYPITSSGP